MLKGFENITKEDLRVWVIRKVFQLFCVIVCIGLGYVLTGLFGVKDNIRACLAALVALGGINYLKAEKILPADFLDSDKPIFNKTSLQIILIVIWIVAVLLLIFAAVVVYAFVKQNGGL